MRKQHFIKLLYKVYVIIKQKVHAMQISNSMFNSRHQKQLRLDHLRRN